MLLQIMKRASETLIPVTLELGGKDSFIVCEDVDLPSVRESMLPMHEHYIFLILTVY
jgi:acyl-CoA reductase-like NAD-dependent aldehyde dehydrogenase